MIRVKENGDAYLDFGTGHTMSEAIKGAWANIKLRALLGKKVVEYKIKKNDGTLRQAFGTLMSENR